MEERHHSSRRKAQTGLKESIIITLQEALFEDLPDMILGELIEGISEVEHLGFSHRLPAVKKFLGSHSINNNIRKYQRGQITHIDLEKIVVEYVNSLGQTWITTDPCPSLQQYSTQHQKASYGWGDEEL